MNSLTVKSELVKVRSPICISWKIQTNDVKLTFSTDVHLEKYQKCIS